MDVRVRFRLNKATGEVEVFEVADDGPMRLSEAEHNREHDRIATELGRVIERNPQVDEVFGRGQPISPLSEGSTELTVEAESEEPQTSERNRSQT